jgi:hypothetical protein
LIPGGFSYSLRPAIWIRIGSGSSILLRWEFFNLNPGLFIADISPLSRVFLLVKSKQSRGTGLFCGFILLDPYPDVRYLARADPDPEELYHLRICLGYETLSANKSWCKYFHFPFVDKMQTSF